MFSIQQSTLYSQKNKTTEVMKSAERKWKKLKSYNTDQFQYF